MKPLEKRLHQLRKLSGQGRPELQLVRSDGRGSHAPSDPPTIGSVRSDLSFQVEPLAAVINDLPALFARHHSELNEDIPLEPDWQGMLLFDASGALKITTARSGDILVGYIFNKIGRHPHCKSLLYSTIDNFWLDPAYRGGWIMRWLRINEAMLDEIGVKKRYIGVRNHFMAGRVGNLFRRLGYKPVETTYSK